MIQLGAVIPLSRRQRRTRKVALRTRPKPPRSISAIYSYRLGVYVGVFNRELVRRAMLRAKELLAASPVPNAIRDASFEEIIQSALNEFLSVSEDFSASSQVQNLVHKISEDVNGWSEKELLRQLKTLQVIPLPRRSTRIGEQLAIFRESNVRKISGLNEQSVNRVIDILTTRGRQGARVEVISEELERVPDISVGRAEFIARDQVLKFNAELNRTRHEEIGVTEYEWITAADERVRPLHAALHGQRFEYRDPPVTSTNGEKNNPGEDYQCRCVANPIINL